MIDIGGWMMDTFGPYGAVGIIIVIFLIFYIDAVFFPTLPEIFFIIGFMYDPTPQWGLVILITASLAEAAGLSTLYYIVEKIGVPERIKNIADIYADFLIVSDEKMLLVNRLAPMLPFAGAFVSLIHPWTLKRALFYNFIGCYLKYGIILLFANFFYTYFGSQEAQIYTIVFVIIVMVLSIIASVIKGKKAGLDRPKKQSEGES